MDTPVQSLLHPSLYSRELIKPDGRTLTLYSRHPISPDLVAPSPSPEPIAANPHLRWHPLRAQWVAYASYRQGRTFLPPPEYNPLMPSDDPEHPTELPAGDYEVAVFDNRFPTLTPTAHDPPASIVETLPATGKCEVVVFTQDPKASLGTLPLAHIDLLFQVWAERTRVIAQDPTVRYVLPFENRGAEVGVTLHHPHGQIYAYPFVPPAPGRMLAQEQQYYRVQGRGLLEHLIAAEIGSAERLLYRGEYAVAFVPACARYPYEVWIAPVEPVPGFAQLGQDQRWDLAKALKTVLLKYDGLWARPFPYLMAWFQAPTDGEPHPESHLHAEFYPPIAPATG